MSRSHEQTHSCETKTFCVQELEGFAGPARKGLGAVAGARDHLSPHPELVARPGQGTDGTWLGPWWAEPHPWVSEPSLSLPGQSWRLPPCGAWRARPFGVQGQSPTPPSASSRCRACVQSELGVGAFLATPRPCCSPSMILLLPGGTSPIPQAPGSLAPTKAPAQHALHPTPPHPSHPPPGARRRRPGLQCPTARPYGVSGRAVTQHGGAGAAGRAWAGRP